MADAWQTYPFEFKGGLISNLSPLQQGTQAPGSARILRNFEPSTDGGYKRILGYEKYDDAFIPYWGKAYVQGSGQTGNTLVVAGLSSAPEEGDTVTVNGDNYIISTGGVSYNASYKQATLTLTTSLTSSYADKTVVTFSNNTSDYLVTGVASWDGDVIATRGNDIYESTGSGFTLISVPSYGTVLVKGAGQTGTTLVVDGLTGSPQIGDVFYINGVQKVYTLQATPTVTSGEATLSIYPALASTPSDNSGITFVSTSFTSGTKTRFTRYRLGSVQKIAGVNGVSYPFTYNGVFEKLTGLADIEGAEYITWFKNSLFFAKGDQLTFTAPFTDDDFSAANGAGVINVGDTITALAVFREQLIIFCEQSIHRLTGNTIADFTLEPITRKIGCVSGDTVQEVGGDIMYLSQDGLRMLSATDRIGDFGLGSKSKSIQRELVDLTSSSSAFASVVIKNKSQYRIFGYSSNVSVDASKGVLGTQVDEAGTFAWAEVVGMKAYVADSDYADREDWVVFANADGYVYRMESGNSFDGANIRATFATPFVPIVDPRIRKTFYKMQLYIDPEGSVDVSANLKFDFDTQGSIQPETIVLSNTTDTVGFYGSTTAKYGSIVYGDKLKKVFETQVIGSGFSVSLQFVSDSTTPPYSFDAATLEFMTHDRR